MKLSRELTDKLRARLGLPPTAGAAEITEAMRSARTRLELPSDATGEQVANAVLGARAGISSQTSQDRDRRTAQGLSLTANQAARLRATLELGANADADAVVDAVAAVVADSLEDAEPTGTAAPDGQTLISVDQLRDLEARAALTPDAATALRDAYLDSVADRFGSNPASREAWERQYDLTPEAVREYLDNAAPMPRIAAPTLDDQPVDVRQDPDYQNWRF